MKKWLGYFVLSIAANAFALSFVKLDKQIPDLATMPIEINIMAMAAPTVKPVVKKKEVKKVVNKATFKAKKIALKKQAKKKVILSEELIVKDKIKTNKTVKKNKPLKQKTKKEIKAEKKVNSNNGRQDSTILHKAKYKLQTPIIYPKRAIKRQQEGGTILKVLVGKLGLPLSIEIKKSSGFSSLDDSAIKAVKKWQFEIKKIHNKALSHWVEVPVKFEIK